MPRIVGIIDSEPRDRSQHLKQMLGTFISKKGLTQKTHKKNQAYFGWCGWGEETIWKIDKLFILLDGYIYNNHDLGDFNDAGEMISLLFRRFGFEEMVKKLNGDFSLALFEMNEDRLWLARDRFGIKPLYYAHQNGTFAFASQPGALLKLPEISNEVNTDFVGLFAGSHYRYFDNNPDHSPYIKILQLPAASILCVKGEKKEKIKYWDLIDRIDYDLSEEEIAEKYKAIFLEAISKRQKVSKNPAFTLSGGMDSSSVLASYVHLSHEKQHAFSSVYVDKTYDETQEISSMLENNVKKWHQVKIDKPDLVQTIKEMIEIHHEPVATATWLSHYLLCVEAQKDGFNSLYGGLGGDELNAGEYEYFFFHFADLKRKGLEGDLKKETESWIEYHNHPIFKKSFTIMEDGLKKLVDIKSSGKCLPDFNRLKRYEKALNKDYANISNFVPAMDHPFQSFLKNRTYQDLFRETIPCCLRAEDRQTFGFGLDNFLPFFDYPLVEFMFRVSGNLKIRNGVMKYLLRKAMKGILPEETRKRIKKTGWNAPAHIWWVGEGKDLLLDIIHSQKFRERNIYNVKEVERLIYEHEKITLSKQPTDNHMMFFWQLINLELWFQSDIFKTH